MSQFIYFTPEEKARAQNTDLVSLLRTQGERPVRSGREFRPPNDPSVTVRGNIRVNDNRIRKLIAPSHGSLDKEVYETPNCRALRRKGYCKVYLSS